MRRILLALILLPVLAFAGPVPKPTSDTVNDWAGVISADDEKALSANLAQARRETGVHVVVVTMNDHADQGGAGESLESYATRLFNDWGVGDAKRHDGVMVLVTPGQRAMRIELGRGFGTEWDGTAKAIIDDTFLPAFKKGEIESGILRGTDEVLERIARRFAKGEKPSERLPLEAWLLVGFAVLFGVGSGIGKLWASFQPCPQCGKRDLTHYTTTNIAPSVDSQGQGTRVTRCQHCGYMDRQFVVIPAIRADRNSGGGGFGGGRSSGGGASGRW